MKRARGGSVRLLTKEDFEKQNAFGKPLVGWRPTSQGEGGLYNQAGWSMLRVVVQKIADGQPLDLYDQPMLVLSAGAGVVCQAGNKVGLVQNYRFVSPRILEAGREYVKRLNEENRWEELMASLGEWKWELPRGLSPLTGEADLAKFVLATAKVEAAEEAGFTLKDARIVGTVNMDTTFYPHPQYVVHGRVVAAGQKKAEDLEIIGQTRLFTGEQIREMATRGEIDDGWVFAGLGLAGFRF